ncbi:MAG: hypothetical protein GY909_18245 [Oligoflexia bacterium]|nr:hypothetical protein [Oligoflexia bacterium]
MKKISLFILSFIFTSLQAMTLDYIIDSNLKGQLRANVDKALENVERVLSDEYFWSKVSEVESFTCTDEKTPSIEDIRRMKIKFHLKGYWHIKKKVKAKTVGSTVSLNKRAGARTVNALSNTIFHEVLHVAGIGHCGVNSISRYPHIQNSIPYVLGRMLEESL